MLLLTLLKPWVGSSALTCSDLVPALRFRLVLRPSPVSSEHRAKQPSRAKLVKSTTCSLETHVLLPPLPILLAQALKPIDGLISSLRLQSIFALSYLCCCVVWRRTLAVWLAGPICLVLTQPGITAFLALAVPRPVPRSFFPPASSRSLISLHVLDQFCGRPLRCSSVDGTVY